jgi:hypothetical protein
VGFVTVKVVQPGVVTVRCLKRYVARLREDHGASRDRRRSGLYAFAAARLLTAGRAGCVPFSLLLPGLARRAVARRAHRTPDAAAPGWAVHTQARALRLPACCSRGELAQSRPPTRDPHTPATARAVFEKLIGIWADAAVNRPPDRPANWVEIVAVALALRAGDHGNLCLVLGWATTRGIRDRLCVSVFLHSTRRAARPPGADWSCSLWALEA